MTDTDNDERFDLGALRATPEPSPRLEKKTIAELRSLGLIRPRARTPWLVAAAAFLIGVAVGGARNKTHDPGYVLLLYGDEPPSTASERDARVHEYAAWASSLRAEGVPITGARLEGEAVRLGNGAPLDADVQGYFLFDADNQERAAEIANGCPHLRYGGQAVLGRIAR